MSLRKSPTMTPARIEANRRNARKSTGPRSARDKAQSRMNSLRTGVRSRFMQNLYLTLLNAPACSVDQVAREILTPEQAAHPLFAAAVDLFRETEIAVVLEQREILGRVESYKSRADHGTGHPTVAVAKGVFSAGAERPAEEQKEFFTKMRERSLNVLENTERCFGISHNIIGNKQVQRKGQNVYENT